MAGEALAGLYILYFILTVAVILIYRRLGQTMNHVDRALSDPSAAATSKIALYVAQEITDKVKIESLARFVEEQVKATVEEALRETRRYVRELSELREDLRYSLRLVRDTGARLERELKELKNRAIAERVSRQLKRNIAELDSLTVRVERLIASLEALQKSLDSRLEGHYGGIISQLRDIRRYMLEVRRETRRICGEARADERREA